MSRKSFKAVFSLAIILCAFLSISAQENTFKEEDLMALKTAAELKLKGKIYRHTTIETFYSNGNKTPDSTSKRIVEIIPPDRYRYMSITETPKGTERYEYIQVGERRFSREDNGEWKESTAGGTGSGMGNGSGSGDALYKLETTIERKLKKGEIVNRQKVDLYETVTTFKYIYPTKTFTSVWKGTYLFDESGRFVKYEQEYNAGEENSIKKTVEEYEYNPKIKIEAPILSKKTKP